MAEGKPIAQVMWSLGAFKLSPEVVTTDLAGPPWNRYQEISAVIMTLFVKNPGWWSLILKRGDSLVVDLVRSRTLRQSRHRVLSARIRPNTSRRALGSADVICRSVKNTSLCFITARTTCSVSAEDRLGRGRFGSWRERSKEKNQVLAEDVNCEVGAIVDLIKLGI